MNCIIICILLKISRGLTIPEAPAWPSPVCDQEQDELCLEIPLVFLTVPRMTSVSLKKLGMTPLTDQELDAVTIVFHQYETGLREGTIYTKVGLIGQ